MKWYIHVLKKYAVDEGRASREEYWMFMLFNTIIYAVLRIVEWKLYGPGIITQIYRFAVIAPTIAVAIRRMHDTDHSGWFQLVPVYNVILAVRDSQPCDNRFGPNPKMITRLDNVCQSIAHHAASGVSYVHPHVLTACRRAGVDHMSLDLLDSEPCPETFRDIEPLCVSLRKLRDTFEHILNAEGCSIADLSFAQLTLSPDPAFSDDYCSICRAKLTSKTGQTYEHVADCLGQERSA